MQALFSILKNYFFTSKRLVKFSGSFFINSMEDLSEVPLAGKLILVGSKSKAKWLKFLCPCGCGEVCALNLMKSYYPFWTVELNEDRTISVKPSVHSQKCGAHFWISKNRIHWC